MFTFHKEKLQWIHEPKKHEISDSEITITTDPNTDFWQRTYYGFQNDNAPAILMKTNEKYFSFTVKATSDSSERFDQCGVIIYQDSDNWFKASMEYENENCQRLGSVVTNHGYSDWATTDIDAAVKTMFYRLSRRESDYCIENSENGEDYKQMRIFHLFKATDEISFGLYACSPSNTTFKSIFTDIEISDCRWQKHE